MPAVLFTLNISGLISGLVHHIEHIFSGNQSFNYGNHFMIDSGRQMVTLTNLSLELVPVHKPVAVTRFVPLTACPSLGRVPLWWPGPWPAVQQQPWPSGPTDHCMGNHPMKNSKADVYKLLWNLGTLLPTYIYRYAFGWECIYAHPKNTGTRITAERQSFGFHTSKKEKEKLTAVCLALNCCCRLSFSLFSLLKSSSYIWSY